MNKLKAILIGSVVASSGTMAFAGASAGFDVTDAYIFRGATINDEVNVQPSLEATIEDGALAGLTLGTWANFNTDSEQFDEIDYYVSYNIALGEDKSVDIGYTEYTYPGGSTVTIDPSTLTIIDVGGIDADREVSLGASGVCPLTGSDVGLTAYYGLDGAIEEALYLELGVSKGMDVCSDASIEGGLTVGAMANQAKGSTADEGVSYVMLTAGTTMLDMITVTANYVIETDDKVLAVDEDLFFSIGTSIDF